MNGPTTSRLRAATGLYFTAGTSIVVQRGNPAGVTELNDLCGIVVAKGQPRLRDAVQGAFEELLRGGVYAEGLARWHVQSGAVQQITFNSNR